MTERVATKSPASKKDDSKLYLLIQAADACEPGNQGNSGNVYILNESQADGGEDVYEALSSEEVYHEGPSSGADHFYTTVAASAPTSSGGVATSSGSSSSGLPLQPTFNVESPGELQYTFNIDLASGSSNNISLTPVGTHVIRQQPLSVGRPLPKHMTVKPGSLPRKRRDGGGRVLWEFLLALLNSKNFNPKIIRWMSRETCSFRLVDSKTVSWLWGLQKGKADMSYEKLGAALRYYYTIGLMRKIPGQRLAYQFCESYWHTVHSFTEDAASFNASEPPVDFPLIDEYYSNAYDQAYNTIQQKMLNATSSVFIRPGGGGGSSGGGGGTGGTIGQQQASTGRVVSSGGTARIVESTSSGDKVEYSCPDEVVEELVIETEEIPADHPDYPGHQLLFDGQVRNTAAGIKSDQTSSAGGTKTTGAAVSSSNAPGSASKPTAASVLRRSVQSSAGGTGGVDSRRQQHEDDLVIFTSERAAEKAALAAAATDDNYIDSEWREVVLVRSLPDDDVITGGQQQPLYVSEVELGPEKSSGARRYTKMSSPTGTKSSKAAAATGRESSSGGVSFISSRPGGSEEYYEEEDEDGQGRVTTSTSSPSPQRRRSSGAPIGGGDGRKRGAAAAAADEDQVEIEEYYDKSDEESPPTQGQKSRSKKAASRGGASGKNASAVGSLSYKPVSRKKQQQQSSAAAVTGEEPDYLTPASTSTSGQKTRQQKFENSAEPCRGKRRKTEDMEVSSSHKSGGRSKSTASAKAAVTVKTETITITSRNKVSSFGRERKPAARYS